MSSRSDPVRPAVSLSLAQKQFLRYTLSNDKEDLDKSIFHLTESILHPPHSWLENGSLLLRALFILAIALFKRSKESNQPEDATYSAKYLRHLRDQALEIYGISRHRVTLFLVDALAVRVQLDAANMMEDIGEMAVLFRELLTSSDASEGEVTHLIGLVISTCGAVFPKLNKIAGVDQPLDQLIECLRLARMYKPELQSAHLTLAFCLLVRYQTTFINDDYEEGASILDEIVTSSSPGECRDESVAMLQLGVTIQALVRSRLHGNPEYSEEAIYRAQAFLSSSSVDDPIRAVVAAMLDYNAKSRLQYFGSVEDLEESFRKSLVSFEGHKYATPESDRIREKVELLTELYFWIRNSDITKVDEGIEKGRIILASSSPREPHASFLFGVFGYILDEAFHRTKKIEYLTESINTRRQALEHSSDPMLRFWIRGFLSLSLVIRSVLVSSLRAQDLDEAMEHFSLCANDGHAILFIRFLLACMWANIARINQHPSVSAAYETAVLLVQDTPLIAPTLQLQHSTLARFDNFYSIPLDYTSYQVDVNRVEKAIETLERGRALLWSEMHHLRTSIDQILQVDSQLGHKFAAVNRDLEELSKSNAPSLNLGMNDGAADYLRAVDPFGRLLLKQRSLLKEREKLISQIRVLPGFETFLTSPTFGALRSAASGGPVIIINCSVWRSDILILLHNMSPSLIPTPRDFYGRASAMKDKLLDSRHIFGLDSSEYDQALASVLAELYNLVGKPVIDRLRQLQIPEQSRIWWCPTSVFCSLPLHAMGPIPSDAGEIRYFLDLYICSYTPTLSALIQSRNRDPAPRSSDRPSIMLVALPDPSLPTVEGEIQVVQALEALDIEVTSFVSETAIPAAVIDSFPDHQFIHFACHGTLEDDKPFEAGFELDGGERLTLLEIVRSHLPTAEFAFLSACHTAEITKGSVVDEGLHLAAAVQYCGFRSVVGTSWAMVDKDGRDLAKYFYKALFSTSSREPGIRYHERSAKSLRIAVKKLRKKRNITLERWVNFVHYGA